jgi:hypothetical protein
MRVLRWGMYVAGGSGSYRGLSYASPTTPWDSGIRNLGSSIETLHHPSQASPTEATQYMNQYLMRARGKAFSWEGATLVDPILRSSSQVDLTGIVDSVMGHSRERRRRWRESLEERQREYSGSFITSRRYVLSYTPFVDAGKPIWTASSYSYVVEYFEKCCASRDTSSEDQMKDKLTRTKHWIERS